MATTFQEYTGDGNATKSFSFPSIQESDVKVRVDGVLKTTSTHYNITSYTTTGGGNVVFTSGNIPVSGTIRIYRDTNVDSPKATYTPGSSIKASDLNSNNTQLLYRSQEEQVPNLIQSYDINPSAIETSNLKDDSVTSDKIADDQINSEHYVAGSIDHEHLANDIIDGDNIQDDVINSEHYAAASIDHEHLANDIIDGDNIQDNVINSEHYVDASIDHVHLSNDCIDADNIQDNAVGSEHIQADAVTDSEIATGTLDNRYYTETELNAGQLDNRYYTESELDAGQLDNRYFTETELSNGALDGRYFTETEVEDNFLRQDSSETIASGVTWSSVDSKVATTKAIDLRIIDLVDDVGGFVPIADELSFPNDNPDINDPDTGGTIVSIKSIGTSRTPTAGTVTIANGTVGNSTVTITGCGTTVLAAGFGVLVEATSTLNTYTFHRLVPKATEVSTVAANAVNIAAAGANITNIDNFADRYQISTSAPTDRPASSSLVLGDLWFDSSSNKVMMVYDASAGDGFSPITPNQSDLANINIVAGQLIHSEDLGLITNALTTGTGNASISTVATNISNVNTAATNIAKITTVADDLNESTSEIDTVATNIANVNTVGNNIANINAVNSNETNINAVQSNATNINAVANNATNINTVAGNNTNINTVAGANSNITTVAGANSNISAVAGAISNVNTTASNIANVNNFAATYQIASSAPSTDGAGNALAAGDLYFDTSANELRVHNGSTFQGGVTATGNLAGLGANTFTGLQTLQAALAVTGNITVSGTVDGVDIAAFKTSFDNLSTDIVNDTSPQLGGTLDGQNNNMSNIGTIDGTNLTLDFGTL